MINLDNEKKRKRKKSIKASRITYVCCKAVNEGTINLMNKDEVKRIRKGIPKVRFTQVNYFINYYDN